MAIYHLSAQVIGRSSGRSSVAAAAYRAGEGLRDERTGRSHDYGRRREIESWIQAPAWAPDWATDRGRLWNEVEASERRSDSQLAREINVALPVELSRERQGELVRSFVREQLAGRGMVADVAVHRQDPGNPHAHVMLTTRSVGEGGFGPKARGWNRPEELAGWREAWAVHANRELEREGREERVDHRSHGDRGLDREPTVREGPDAREAGPQCVARQEGRGGARGEGARGGAPAGPAGAQGGGVARDRVRRGHGEDPGAPGARPGAGVPDGRGGAGGAGQPPRRAAPG